MEENDRLDDIGDAVAILICFLFFLAISLLADIQVTVNVNIESSSDAIVDAGPSVD